MILKGKSISIARLLIQNPSLLFSTGSTNDTPYSLIRNMKLACYFSERFSVLNTMKNGRPFSNGYFPVRV
jgi:hypothetical protein